MPKSFGYLRKARPPINTYKDFFNSDPNLGKKRKVKRKEPEVTRASADEPRAMKRHKDSYVVVKRNGPKRRFSAPSIKSVPEYKQHELREFVKKRHYNRWTSNPRTKKKEPAFTPHTKLIYDPTKQLTYEQRKLTNDRDESNI